MNKQKKKILPASDHETVSKKENAKHHIQMSIHCKLVLKYHTVGNKQVQLLTYSWQMESTHNFNTKYTEIHADEGSFKQFKCIIEKLWTSKLS